MTMRVRDTAMTKASGQLRNWATRFAQMGEDIEAARKASEEADMAGKLQEEINKPGLVNRMVYFSVLVQVPPGMSEHEVIGKAASYMRSVPDAIEYLADKVSSEPKDDDE